MDQKQPYLEQLTKIEWQKDTHIPLPPASYRYQIVVVCSPHGRQKAQFANGIYPYFTYVEQLDKNHQWIERGTTLVPVLPDGRLLTVIEQRPVLARHPDIPYIAVVGGKKLDLRKFGPYSSLEFPGGAVDPNEEIRAGFLRELIEETEIGEQTATLFMRRRPLFMALSEIASCQHFGVAFLSGMKFEEKTESDGGLWVHALHESEVAYNIIVGVMHSSNTEIGFELYCKVKRALQSPVDMEIMIQGGYLERIVTKVKLGK